MKNHLSQGRPGPNRLVRIFLRDDDGAVTVDWVVLTAAIVLMGIAAGFTVTSTVPDLASDIGSFLESTTVMPN